MQQRIEHFRAWAVRNGWPASFMNSDIPAEWQGGLKAIFDLWSGGWIAHEQARERTLVFDE